MRLGVQQSCNKKLCVKQLPNCYNFFHRPSRHNLSPNKNYFQVNINSQRATKLFRIVFIKSFLPFLPLSAPKITSKAPLTLPSVTYTLIGFFFNSWFFVLCVCLFVLFLFGLVGFGFCLFVSWGFLFGFVLLQGEIENLGFLQNTCPWHHQAWKQPSPLAPDRWLVQSGWAAQERGRGQWPDRK